MSNSISCDFHVISAHWTTLSRRWWRRQRSRDVEFRLVRLCRTAFSLASQRRIVLTEFSQRPTFCSPYFTGHLCYFLCAVWQVQAPVPHTSRASERTEQFGIWIVIIIEELQTSKTVCFGPPCTVSATWTTVTVWIFAAY